MPSGGYGPLASQVFPLALLIAVAAWIYWPGIQGPELLDDRSSVNAIQQLEAHPERALDVVFGDNSGLLGRSVSIATFVVEKLYFDDGLQGHKRVNILLHLLIGALLVWLLTLLFSQAQVPGYRWLALLLGAVWLLHPLLVSTVLYVVQRMAMLSTLFMLLSMISYLYWRALLRPGQYRLLWFLPALFFLALGLFAKENAAVVVPVILLMEVLWLRCRDTAGADLRALRLVSTGLIVAGAIAALLLVVLGWDYFEGRYRYRPYVLEERLLTQPRVLWDYVGQWFAPDVQRMGLYHDDVSWSRAFTQPLSTAYAVVGLVAVALGALLSLRWQVGRWIAFGVGWFLAGHVIESTVWPLELYFEHRNYFPAMGLLLVPGALLATFLRRWPETRAPALLLAALAPLLLALMTSSQVQLWSSRPLLVLAHLNGHPDSSRANVDMAVQMARLGDQERAHHYSERAFESSTIERQGDWAVRDIALSCIARAPVSSEDIGRIGETNTRRPLGSVSTLLTLVRMVQDGECPQIDATIFADHLASLYLGPNAATASSSMYANLAVLENALQRYRNALAYTEKHLALRKNSKRGLLMQLHFATALEDSAAAAEAIELLQAMQQQGKLTQREQQTLELYLE